MEVRRGFVCCLGSWYVSVNIYPHCYCRVDLLVKMRTFFTTWKLGFRTRSNHRRPSISPILVHSKNILPLPLSKLQVASTLVHRCRLIALCRPPRRSNRMILHLSLPLKSRNRSWTPYMPFWTGWCTWHRTMQR